MPLQPLKPLKKMGRHRYQACFFDSTMMGDRDGNRRIQGHLASEVTYVMLERSNAMLAPVVDRSSRTVGFLPCGQLRRDLVCTLQTHPEIRGPKHHISIRILHACSKVQGKEDLRNHTMVCIGSYVYVAF